MHWLVVAPFFREGQQNNWIDLQVPKGRHTFTHVNRPSGGEKLMNSSAETTQEGWKFIWKHAGKAIKEKSDGIVTVFPQQAAMIGLRRKFSFDRRPIVAWCFNFGNVYGGVKGAVARSAFRSIKKFIVHSRGEIKNYSDWLQISPDRFQFEYLQRFEIPVTEQEDRNEPFVLAMGSARRDYKTFFEAVSQLKVKTVVVAAPFALNGLTVPSNVTVKSGLTRPECYALAQKARVNVIPVINDKTASGQVTVIEAMRQKRAIIATRCMGTVDYLEDGKTGMLTEPFSVESMKSAIDRLWNDDALRTKMGEDAGKFAEDHCSDAAAGKALNRVLDDVELAEK